MSRTCLLACVFAMLLAASAPARKPLELMDVFRLEYADDPQVSPDGKRVVYARNFFDVKKDRRRSNLWIVNADGTGHEALTTGSHSDSHPRWAADGKRLLYLSDVSGSSQIYCRWVESGRTAKLTDLTAVPLAPAWSPDGRQIAFAMHVAPPARPFVELPVKPEGAEWAPPFQLIRGLNYRDDGKGYRKEGNVQLFVMPAEGGSPRQVTEGPFDHPGVLWADEGPGWSADSRSLLVAANRRTDGAFDPLDTEIYEVTVADGRMKPLTNRRGPDHHPVASPDGKHIAYLGYDDRKQSYQQPHLYVMNRDGTDPHVLLPEFDRPVRAPVWQPDSSSLYFPYEDKGSTRIGLANLRGMRDTVAKDVSGTTLGRPYASGAFSVGAGTVAFTLGKSDRPANIAVVQPGDTPPRWLTNLNESLRADRVLAVAEELWYESGKRKVQGWMLKPPGFDPKKKYPLMLEIHGGPFADYGDRYSAEMQLCAGAGYVVFYANPPGSTGYGEEFASLIHHAYPGPDYDDLMAGVDAVIAKGYIDKDQLYVTGGSGGGILTCWTVGKTRRFRAAVACFPVVNWSSFVLTTDAAPFFTRHWFPGPPWEHTEHYRQRSPLSLVANVTTPTMLLTGEEDYRCPISESEQFYMALKLRKVDAALVRVPGASHNVSARPSHLIAKVAHILKWFEMHRKAP